MLNEITIHLFCPSHFTGGGTNVRVICPQDRAVSLPHRTLTRPQDRMGQHSSTFPQTWATRVTPRIMQPQES